MVGWGNMNFRPETDGLRALAVVPVILYHAGVAGFTGGYIGVDVFFVISGFLITSILTGELSEGRYSIVNFYDRRIRRIMPALLLVIVCSGIAAWIILLPADLDRFSISAIAAISFWSNLFFWRESGYFDTETALKPLLHTWSLAVEEQFYIFFPLLLALLWRFGKTVTGLSLAAICALSLGLGFLGFVTPDAVFYLLPTRAWQLMLGALAALYMMSPHHPGMLGNVMALLGLALIVMSIPVLTQDTPFPSLLSLASTLGAALVLVFEHRGSWTFHILANPLCRGIGLISYSAYLWHQPLFAFARYLAQDAPSLVVMAALSLASFALAWASFRYVETPIRQSYNRRMVFTGTAVLSAIVVTMGLAGWLSQGAPGRYDPRHQAIFAQFEQPGDYVSAYFNQQSKAEFDSRDPRRKLLIIGDSYGQDMANAVHETDLKDQYQLITYKINKRCGNLFVQLDISGFISAGDLALCAKQPGYKDPALQARIKAADEIWLVSSWKLWQVDYLPQTLENIRARSSAEIRIMGRKNFGSSISLRGYWQNVAQGNDAMLSDMSAEHLKTNDRMRAVLPADVFVDISQMMCGANSTCIKKPPMVCLFPMTVGIQPRRGPNLWGSV
jgi:peptidoglycan/LPS O-acetylase OafA/YrhL